MALDLFLDIAILMRAPVVTSEIKQQKEIELIITKQRSVRISIKKKKSVRIAHL